MRNPYPVAVLALVLVACTANPPGATPSSTETTGAPTTSTSPSSTTAGPANCGEGDPMIESGPLLDITQPSTDAESIGLITWEAVQGCERFTIELVTAEGAPATTPPSVIIELMRDLGILRVSLGLERTAVTDQLVETALVDRYFVVREFDRTLFVDLHLSSPVLARATVRNGPGVVSVELEPGGAPYTGAPALGDLVVLTSPVAGETSAVPVLIEGYGRPFEATVVYWFEQGSTILLQDVTNSADYSETWGSFSTTADPGVSGEIQLFVGQLSAEDGSPRGVTIDLALP